MTDWMQAASVVSTLLVTGGLLFVGVAQLRSNKLQTSIVLATQQAILNVKQMRAYAIVQYNEPISFFAIVPEIENVGIRPTMNCVARTYSRVSESKLDVQAFDFVGIDRDFNAVGRPIYKRSGPRYFGPKSIVDGYRAIIPTSELSAAHQDHMFVYVWGWLDYDDGFDGTPRRRTEFAYEVIVRGDPLQGGDAFRFVMLEK